MTVKSQGIQLLNRSLYFREGPWTYDTSQYIDFVQRSVQYNSIPLTTAPCRVGLICSGGSSWWHLTCRKVLERTWPHYLRPDLLLVFWSAIIGYIYICVGTGLQLAAGWPNMFVRDPLWTVGKRGIHHGRSLSKSECAWNVMNKDISH